jgi:O-antigen/teichoic acid export membrane protein
MNLGKAGLYYTISDALFGGLPVLLTPLLAYYINPDEFAVYINLTVLMLLSSVIIDFGSTGYFGVSFHKGEKLSRRVYVDSIVSMLVNMTIFTILIYIFIDDISEVIGTSKLYIYISVLAGFCTSINMLFLTKLRYNEKVISFVSIRILQVFIHFILAVILVVYSDKSWVGRYIAHFAPIFLLFFWVLIDNKKILISFSLISYGTKKFFPQFIFGLTLMPHALSSWVKTGFDRLYLTDISGLLSNGIYSTAFQLSMVVALVGVGFNKALAPEIFKDMEHNNGRSTKKILSKFVIYNFYFTILVIISFQFIGRLLLPENYHASLEILPYLLIAQGLLNIYIVYSNLMFYFKLTLKLSLISVFTATFHVLLLMALIEEYDVLGASISFLMSAIVQVIMVIYYVNLRIKSDCK